MTNRLRRKIIVHGLIFLLLNLTVNALTSKQEFPLQPVDRDRPFSLKVEEEIGQRCELRMTRIRGNSKIEKPPLVEANVLYYAEAVFGNPPKTYGLLVDLEGERRQIWVDADGDRDFAEETSYEIFKSDRYPGLNVYYSPMPLRFVVTCHLATEEYSIPVYFDLPFLIVARAGYHDYLLLKTRTWLAGNLTLEGEEIPIALVDMDFNGCFNDPQDLFFMDTDYDLNFASSEAVEIRNISKLRFKRGSYQAISFSSVPKALTVTY
ncbi:MAG: hypothetical protein GX050_04710 [Firmicutes bacterium]|nr:hypothetical protein [Bacillota bacterium]